MQILLLSIMAKCGVFTHVRDLAHYLKKCGMDPLIGLINSAKTRQTFRLSRIDLEAMSKSFEGIPYFLYHSHDELFHCINNKRIELVHAHSPLVYPAAVNTAHHFGIPLVITLHGLLTPSLYVQALEAADSIIAIGPEVANSAGIEYQEKIHIIFNGIDLEHYKIGEYNSPDAPLKILWIGRTSGTAARGAEYLARAVRIIRARGIPIEAKVIGYPLGVDIRGMTVCGWVHDPLPFLQASDITFARGRALREGMACGNVGFLLAHGYGGMVMEDWFKNGRHVQLSGSIEHGCETLNSSHIVNDILYFYENRDQLYRAKMAARKVAEAYFDIGSMVQETCKVYAEASKLHSLRQGL